MSVENADERKGNETIMKECLCQRELEGKEREIENRT